MIAPTIGACSIVGSPDGYDRPLRIGDSLTLRDARTRRVGARDGLVAFDSANGSTRYGGGFAVRRLKGGALRPPSL